jgi:hypothetical protein
VSRVIMQLWKLEDWSTLTDTVPSNWTPTNPCVGIQVSLTTLQLHCSSVGNLDYKLLISLTNAQLLLLIGSLDGSTKCHHNTCLLTWDYIPNLCSTRGVSHCGLAIYIFFKKSSDKTRIMEMQIFHHAKI